MIELKDLTPDFLAEASRGTLIYNLVETVGENDRRIKEEKRFREFEGDCLNILSEFAPWAHRTKEGKILGSLLEAIDKIQDSREGKDL